MSANKHRHHRTQQRAEKFLPGAIGLISCIVFFIFLLVGMPGPVGAQESGTPKAPAAKGQQLVSIDFNNVDIGVFIKFISDLTQKNFVVDDKVRGKVTIISPGKR